ncbi:MULTISPECIES: MDR family oxidoreductase [unclassified Gilliamella]|uniref:acrylyl-CoA reductase (NADPH) n=1 Tax=unclassified Gilliamella TaxID=2685620 RepID=UPI00226A6CEB|nr:MULTISPECIES: MDR family oxidoreductase [unclassified Gilliamella]MCX8641207.1 oxidoreductase [Gilliamella sp. B3835]MCX8707034.1 oxidoreductase [Gilliamella sp. B3783]MCX8710469.1 oxidoreductase [Gilliamella sp. B3780]MCX8715151.1 oxidoreductase [Gilliamella sp. B3781]MCX8716017.1 oxidoreductase [Gilliamella sp. B3784]
MSFNAIILEKDEINGFSHSLKTITKQQLLQQQGDTLVQIHYSSINYKDALALTHKSPVVRQWPMVPGIDGVGTVIESNSDRYHAGDTVILNGWGCGETHWGCLAQYAYLKSDWLIPLPQNITPYQSMIIGTAGYTAALCVKRIVDFGIKPQSGTILVTGASGGVGSVAVALLSKLGYQVTASTGKLTDTEYLNKLGASNIIDSKQLKEAGKPLQKEQWSAVVDVVGSYTLANVCAQTQYGGIVACCGLAQGMDLPATVAPFILRGVTLAGVDSVMASYDKRIAAWQLIAENMDEKLYSHIAQTITLNECFEVANKVIASKIKGRFVVDVNN